MKKFSGISISKVLLFLTLSVFCVLTAKAEGEQYYKAYNEILRGIHERRGDLVYNSVTGGWDFAHQAKSPGSSVTQGDLNLLRGKIAELYGIYIDKSKIQTDVVDPFADAGLTIKFTKVPGEYTDKGIAVLSNDFVDVPILWMHFEEMADALRKLKTRKCSAPISYYNSFDNFIFYDSGIPYPFPTTYDPPVPWMWGEFYNYSHITSREIVNRYENGYQVEHTDIVSDSEETVKAYILALPLLLDYDSAKDNIKLFTGMQLNRYSACESYNDYIFDWGYRSAFDTPYDVPRTPYEAPSETLTETCNYYDDGVLYTAYCCNSSNCLTVTSSYFVIDVDDKCPERLIVSIANPGRGPDSNTNDLSRPCCPTCSAKGLVEDFSVNGITATYPLGVSKCSPGMREFAYLQSYSFAGITKMHFSLDIGLSIFGGNQDVNGTTVYWLFAQVQRPKGANTLMVWKDWNLTTEVPNRAEAVEGAASYNLIRIADQNGNTSQYEIKFGDDITHVFDSGGGFVEAYKIENGEKLEGISPFSGLTVVRDGSKVISVTSRFGTITPIYAYIQLTANNLTGKYNRNDLCLAPSVAGQVLSSSLLGEDPPPGSIEVITGIQRQFPDSSPMGDMSFSYTSSNGVTTQTTTMADSNNNIIGKTEFRSLPDTNTESNISEQRIYDGGSNTVAKLTRYATQPITTAGVRDVLETIIAAGNSTSTLIRYKTFLWNEEIIEEVVAYGTSAERTTAYDFSVDQANDGAAYSKLKSQINPDGSWTYYTYDTQGRVSKEITPFGNNALSSNESANRVTEYSYTPLVSGDVTYSGDSRPRCIVRKVNGTEVGREYSVYLPNEYHHSVCRTPGAAYGANDNLDTAYYSYSSGDFSGRQSKIVYPDGSKELYTYSSSGDNLTTIVDKGYGSGDTVTSGTRSVSTEDAIGNQISSAVTDIASGLTLSSETYTLNGFGEVIRTDYLGGTYSLAEYGCCGPTSQTAQDGSVTTMAYNSLKQLDHSASAGITTFYTYDTRGNTVSTTVKGTDNSEQTTTNTYNAAGELVSTTTPDNKTTAYAESWPDGVHYKTTTYPGGSTKVEKYNADGSLAEVSGTAVHPVKYEYGIENGQLYTKGFKVGDNNALDQWQKGFVNMVGGAYKTVYADNSFAQAFFDSANRQIKQVSPSGIVSLTAYGSDGEISASAIDMNRNDTIDYSGPDRVTGYSKSVANKNGVTVRRSVTSVYQDSSGTPTESSVTEISADGLNSWQTSFGRTASIQTTLNGGGSRSVVTTNPDGSTVTSVYQNGKMTSSVHSVLGTTTYIYDAFNRLSTVTRTENGVQKTTTYTYNDAGHTVSVTEDPGNRVTSYTYDDMGRRTSVTYPGSRTVSYTYADTGEALTVTGADTYPQAFTYDAQGRMKTQTTYKAYPGTPEVTTWNYDSARGFMVSKVYPDNKQVAYTNDADGRMLTRVWARGITTTYSYDNGGSQTGVNYSDGTTPAVSYTLDRTGRVTAVTDASGSRTLSYNADGTLANETIPYIVNGAVGYTYDSLGRRTELQLNQNSAAVFANSYTYDAMSRLATVSDGTNTVTYSRISGNNLLNTTTITAGGSTKLTTTRNYDAQNRLTSISSVAGAVTKTYSYTYDANDRRSRLDMADGSYWLYTYDAKGQFQFISVIHIGVCPLYLTIFAIFMHKS